MTIEELLAGEYRDIIMPYVDSRVTNALKVYSARHPSAEDLPGRLAEIEAAIEKKDAELAHEKLAHFAFRKATEAKVDPELLDGFALADEESITAKVVQLAKLASTADLAARNELMVSTSHKPGSGNSGSAPDPARMTPEAREAFYRLEAQARQE